MRLKKIKIVGFKSFADKIVLDFDEGITGIVGPNGCGKSNIADAFRWVLGEQSAKSMRGGKMPDVIFAGTTNRKPLGYAEVSVTLTEIQGALPTDFEEVEVTRRLHRSGESEYLINGHLVRLRDVQGLFLDSGIGKNAFSIFEQGKIEQVINYSPLERRTIFEEAAGIARFLQRKREALRKLELTDQNILRVKDIHGEVEQQIIVLEEQAEEARIYKEHQNTLVRMEKELLVGRWIDFCARHEQTKGEEASREEILEALQREIEGLVSEFGGLKGHLKEGESLLYSKSEDVFRKRSDKAIKTQEQQSNQEKLQEAMAKEQRWLKELASMEKRHKERQEETKEREKEKKKLDKELLVVEGRRQGQQDKVGQMEEKVSTIRIEQQVTQRQLYVLMQVEGQTASEHQQQQLRLQHLEEKLTRLQERNTRLQERQQERKEEIALNRTHQGKAQEGIEEHKRHFATLEKELNQLNSELASTEEEFDKLQEQLTQTRARMAALKRLRDEMEGFSEGAKRLLEFSSSTRGPIAGMLRPLYELIQPEKGREKLFSVMMRPYAQTLVVKTQKEMDQVLTFANEEGISDFSILIASKPQMLAKQFLGGMTMEGNLLKDSLGVIFVIGMGEQNVFLRESELLSLEKNQVEMGAHLKILEKVISTLEDKRSKVIARRLDLDKTIRQAEMRLVEVNFALQGLIADEKSFREDSETLLKEIRTLKEEEKGLKSGLETLKTRHAQSKNKVVEGEKKVEKITEVLDGHVSALIQEQEELKERERFFQAVSDQLRKVEHALNVLEVQEMESMQQEKRLQEEIESIRSVQKEVKGKKAFDEKTMKEVDAALAEVMKVCAAIEKKVAGQRETVEKVERKIAEKQQALKEVEKGLFQVGIKVAQLEAAKKRIEEEVVERHQVNLQSLLEEGFRTDKPLVEVEKGIKEIKESLRNAGDINMTSIEECEKHKTRYVFLNTQMDDLSGSKQELVDIISQLDTESRKIFHETFENIRTSFQKNFAILFDGGEADLTLTESDDVLEAGIEIIAKPPGKQMRSIHLLSGGEKCMTAIALLFAIFEVRPAPFCILDEVDAPLDDSNVERFVNLVKQFIDRCQFIIVTHNKRTMAIADVLFGVSMQERGVSKILSMVFSKTPQLIEK